MSFKDKILDALGFPRDVEAEFDRNFAITEKMRAQAEQRSANASLQKTFGVGGAGRPGYEGLGQPANDLAEPQAEKGAERNIA